MSDLGTQTLKAFMEIDHVICVEEGGRIHDDVTGVYAPEVTVETDSDGQILDEHDAQMIANVRSQGWELLNGWSGQYGYAGPIMHPSEFVGGDLEKHIRETPGVYVVTTVACEPNGWSDDEQAGWAIAYRENKGQ